MLKVKFGRGPLDVTSVPLGLDREICKASITVSCSVLLLQLRVYHSADAHPPTLRKYQTWCDESRHCLTSHFPNRCKTSTEKEKQKNVF